MKELGVYFYIEGHGSKKGLCIGRLKDPTRQMKDDHDEFVRKARPPPKKGAGNGRVSA